VCAPSGSIVEVAPGEAVEDLLDTAAAGTLFVLSAGIYPGSAVVGAKVVEADGLAVVGVAGETVVAINRGMTVTGARFRAVDLELRCLDAPNEFAFILAGADAVLANVDVTCAGDESALQVTGGGFQMRRGLVTSCPPGAAAVSVDTADARIENVVFVLNASALALNAGLGPTGFARHVTFSDNTASLFCGASAVMSHAAFDDIPAFSGPCAFVESVVAGGAGLGVTNAEAELDDDPPSGTFGPLAGSPAIDQGALSPVLVDWTGQRRDQRPDFGAVEVR
jgi:hypothetical protein